MTGLRRSEIVGLWWPDVDLEARALTVRRAVVLLDGKPHVKTPKTARGRQTVELDAGTLASLRRWKVAQMEERLRAGSAWTAREWVFTDELGGSLHPESISTRFERLVREAGLQVITVKGLRHSHATALLKSGTNPKVVAERLGHSSISVTLDIYSAVLPNMQRAAVEQLARSLGSE
jgi:integrase